MTISGEFVSADCLTRGLALTPCLLNGVKAILESAGS